MKCIKHVILSFILALVFLIPHTAHAASDFVSSYDTQYTLTESGQTKVKQTIKITNQVAESYVSAFTLSLGTQKIKDLKATDKTGELQSKYTETASQSAILIPFNDKVVGIGSSRTFTLEYTSVNIAQKQGAIFSVSIPRIKGEEISSYNVTIVADQTIGQPSSIYPQPDKVEKKATQTNYLFTKKQLEESGISFNFGTKQIYNMGLSYHLKNPQNQKVFTEIAIPMNTANQTIVFDSITPKPENITVDQDGNYIAKYILDPKQEINVEFSGKAIVYLNKIRQDPPLTDDQKMLYTKPQKYWEADDKKIASLAASLKTPEKIYRYVVDTLQYNSSRFQSDQYTRKGALSALATPTDSVCMEFTDLFIAIARAAGIPAREINGYGYTNDTTSRPLSLSQDVLHAWPEYWDAQKGWVAVDPTWENTTNGMDFFNSFDLNHIAFVQKGASSQTPYPAGSYKRENATTRDVIVNFTEIEPQADPDIDISMNEQDAVLSGITTSLPVTFQNKGNTAYQKSVEAIVTFQNQRYSFQRDFIVPPGGTYTWQLTGLQSSLIDGGTESIVVHSDTDKKAFSVELIPFFKHSYFLIGLTYIIGIPFACWLLYKLLHKRDVKKRMIK